MLTINDSMKHAYTKFTTQRKSYIKSGNNSFFIQNLDINADCYENGNVIGNAISKIAKFDIETENIKKLDEFEIFDGIWTGNQYEYISLGTFKLFDEEGTDDFFSSITAYDKLINFNKEYNPSLVKFPLNLYDFLKEICNQANVELENTMIPNGSQILTSNQFVENETLKQILKALCQINGCFGIISRDKLKLLLRGSDVLQLDKNQISNPEYKRTTWKINQVILGVADIDGEYVLRQDDDDIAINGVHKLVINDNPFVYNQELKEAYIDNLFNQVKGFGYVAFETAWEGLPYSELGDLLNLDGHESIILRYNLRSPNGLDSTLSAPSIIDSVVDYVDNSDTISNKQKRTERIVDKGNQIIQDVIELSDEQNQKISQLTQTVNEIKSEISEVADITISADGYGYVKLSNINESEPIYIRIYPTTNQDISYLYPRDNLYPSDDLYPKGRTLRFTNTSNNQVIEYELPNDLLYYDDNNYDEFILDYDAQTCEVNKKVGYKADGSKYLLEQPQTISYTYPNIHLSAGDYVTSLPAYDDAYMFVRMMVQNIYTDQFATKMELNSSITQTVNSITSQVSANYATKNQLNSTVTQTANEIKLEVAKKVGNDEIISRINQTPEAVTIQANKVNINGVINAINNDKTTTINGDKITTGSITATQVSSDVITTKNFSAQKINADNITSGTISSARLDSKVITTDNFSAQKINADNITSGTLSANKINGGTINTSAINLGSGTFTANTSGVIKASSGTIGGWTINSDKLGGTNTYLNPNGSCQFYPSGGAIVGWNNAIRLKGPSGIAIYNTHTNYGSSTSISKGIHIMADSGNLNLMNENSAYGVNIRSYCSSSTVGNAGERSIRLAAAANVAMYAVGGYCYAAGSGVSSSKIKTDSGSASSKNVKTNILEFDKTKYDSAIELLEKLKIYDYNYKYDLYQDRAQYGFIIDEIQEIDNKFFKITNEKAIVNGEHLDFNLENKKDSDEIITVKKYDSDTLDKYLLTVCKALLNKVNTLEKELEEIKNAKN